MCVIKPKDKPIMPKPRTRLVPPLVVLMSAALLGGPASPATAQPSLSLGLGGADLNVAVGSTPSSAVVGEVAVLPYDQTKGPLQPDVPTPMIVFKHPSGCIALPPIAHNLYNETNAAVITYVDSDCTIPALLPPSPILPGFGGHVDNYGVSIPLPLPNYFQATPAVALTTGVGGLQAGVSLTGPTPDIAPVVLFLIDGIPMVDYDNPDQSCGLLPGAAHTMLNQGTGTLHVYSDASCATEVNAVPPGDSVHVITDFSWNYTAGAPNATPATASTPKKSACVKVGRLARTSHKRGAKTVRACKSTKKAIRTAKHRR
jgi:hypothetical protein